MAKGVSIEVQGLDHLIKKFGEIPKRVEQQMDAAMARTANEFENRAVQDAPVDQGILKNEITTERKDVMDYRITSGANWSAFIEFGTRNRASIPGSLTDYAAQFRGAGGSANGKGFFDQILAWVKRKGITGSYSVKTHRRLGSKDEKDQQDREVAFAIYRSILFQGINPHPFFFKQLPQAAVDFNKYIAQIVKQALSK